VPKIQFRTDSVSLDNSSCSWSVGKTDAYIHYRDARYSCYWHLWSLLNYGGTELCECLKRAK